MTVWTKQGVRGVLSHRCQKAFGRVAKLYAALGYDLFVTSIMEGNHSAGSFHYIGDAFDIQYCDGVTIEALRAACGPDFDVVFEHNHIHIEYDPS